jgi:hypothetical protein
MDKFYEVLDRFEAFLEKIIMPLCVVMMLWIFLQVIWKLAGLG